MSIQKKWSGAIFEEWTDVTLTNNKDGGNLSVTSPHTLR